MMYTVGEMAKILGVPASTLWFYDKVPSKFRKIRKELSRIQQT